MLLNRSLKFLILASGLILALLPLSAQTVRVGAGWEVKIGQGMGSYGIVRQLVSCDTLQHNGQVYHWLAVSGSDCGPSGYVREDSLHEKVYFIPADDPNLEELLIADYSLEVGDSFYFHNGAGWQTVEEVRVAEFEGAPRRFIGFPPTTIDGFWEDYGSVRSGLVPLCEGFTRVDDYYEEELDCTLVNSQVEPDLETVALFPNPLEDQLWVRLPPELGTGEGDWELAVYGIGGTCWWRGALAGQALQSLSTTDWPAGLLVAQLSRGGERRIFYLLKNGSQ
ncbi:MAG: hypothetical protein AAFW73_11780 [Bacteroidota bacterium]